MNRACKNALNVGKIDGKSFLHYLKYNIKATLFSIFGPTINLEDPLFKIFN